MGMMQVRVPWVYILLCSRIDFNTQEDHTAKDKPTAKDDSSAQRLKDAVSSIFSVSRAFCFRL